MNKKPILLIFFLLPVIPFLLPAQTAAEIEELLGTEAVSYEQAARFILKAADLRDFSSPEEAFRFAAEQLWLPKKAVSGGRARLDGVSLLLMGSFSIKGGLFYTLSKNPHYAYRELLYRDIIQGRSDPEMAVSGDFLLFLVNRVLAVYEEGGAFIAAFEPQALLAAEEEQQRFLAGGEEHEKLLAAEEELRKQWALEEAEHREAEQQRLLAAEEELQRRRRSMQEAERVDMERRIAEQQALARRLAEQQALAREINSRLAAQEVAETSARVTEEGVTISLSNIQFTANSAELPESEQRKLREINRILQTVSGRQILVAGHTALAGTLQDRMKTSLERAQAVASFLISLGARKPEEISIRGYGSDQPIAANSSPQGMALNRRVEITILEKR